MVKPKEFEAWKTKNLIINANPNLYPPTSAINNQTGLKYEYKNKITNTVVNNQKF
jgi:hypothetical protein